MSESALPARARRVAFPPNWPVRITLIALALYVIYAATILDITWARFVAGFGHGARFISRMFPPSVAPDKLELLYGGMLESLQIAIIATVVGVLISLPLGLCAARNLVPLPLAWAARALIALFRTFHPVIVNIHNVELARRFADRIIGMSKGEIVFDGTPQALEQTHLKQIYGGEGWLE